MIVQVIHWFKRIKAAVTGVAEMLPWFSSSQKEPQSISWWNVTLSSSCSMSSSLCASAPAALPLLLHLSHLLGFVKQNRSWDKLWVLSDLIIWHDCWSCFMHCLLRFVRLEKQEKSLRQLKNWQVNQSVPSLHVHLLHALNGIFFLFLIFLTWLCQTNAQLCLCTQKFGLVWVVCFCFFVFPSG